MKQVMIRQCALDGKALPVQEFYARLTSKKCLALNPRLEIDMEISENAFQGKPLEPWSVDVTFQNDHKVTFAGSKTVDVLFSEVMQAVSEGNVQPIKD